jgi:uncharacterized Tic20 family protein
MPDDPPPDAEELQPDPEPAPPPVLARRTDDRDRRRDDRYDDEDDGRDAEYHPRGRHAKYDEDGYEITSEHTMWAVFAHLGPIFASFIPPLVILLVYAKKSPFVVRQARESLNRYITFVMTAFLITAVAAGIGFAVYGLTQDPPVGIVVGYMLLIGGSMINGIVNIVFMILAAVTVSRGEPYRYPFTIRLIG